MKKLISLLAVALIFVTCLVPAAFAADAGLSASSATAAPGGEVTLTVSVSEATFATYLVELDYDSSVLEYVSSTGSFGLFSGSAYAAGGMQAADSTYGGTLFTITFKVAEGAADGEYPVNVIVDNFTKADAVTGVSVSGATGVVTVEAPEAPCEHSWTANYDETYHWEECSCGEIQNKEEHTFGDWIDNGDGTQTKSCECGYSVTEDIVVPTEKPEEPEPTKKPADPEPTKKPVDPSKSPQTGDFTAFVVIAVLCAAAVVVIVSSKKSKAQK